MKTIDAIRALAALAQGTRLEVYRLLVQQGPEGLPPSAIAEKLGLPNATLSFHLKELSQADLVAARHDGRFIFYSARYPTMSELVAYLTDNCCGGRDCSDVREPAIDSERKSA
jgi:ArsR family transcriptional regulator, arsenate/arsenite/antimonite-responsive transcriptional repressor